MSLRSRGAAGLIAGRRDITGLNQLLSLHRLDILLDVPAKKRSEAADRLSRIESMLTDMQTELGLEYVDASLPSVFPRPLLDARDVVQDVLESRNRASQRTNYDGMYIVLVVFFFFSFFFASMLQVCISRVLWWLNFETEKRRLLRV